MNSLISKQAQLAANSFTNLNWDRLAQNIVDKAFSLIMTILIFFLILGIGKRIINSIFHNTKRITLLGGSHRAETFHSIILNIYRYTCYFFFLYAILSLIGVPIGTLIAGAGIFSIALGLGAQGFVSDVVNGFFILLEQQIDVGDIVQIGTIKGTVKAVGLRTTQVLGSDGTLTFIQNRNITMVQNFSRHDLTANVDIAITTKTPLNELKLVVENLTDEIMNDFDNLTSQPQIIGPTTNQNGQLVYRIMITAKSGTQTVTASKILARYLQAAQQAQIELQTTSHYPIN